MLERLENLSLYCTYHSQCATTLWTVKLARQNYNDIKYECLTKQKPRVLKITHTP